MRRACHRGRGKPPHGKAGEGEAFGGAGYIEDTGLPRLLRDAQVLSIWEGTTNILSLDALRAIEKTDALAVWISDARRRVASLRAAPDSDVAKRVGLAVESIEAYGRHAAQAGGEFQQAGARGLAYSVARTEAAILLLETAAATEGRAAAAAAARWAARDVVPLVEGDASHRADSTALLD